MLKLPLSKKDMDLLLRRIFSKCNVRRRVFSADKLDKLMEMMKRWKKTGRWKSGDAQKNQYYTRSTTDNGIMMTMRRCEDGEKDKEGD